MNPLKSLVKKPGAATVPGFFAGEMTAPMPPGRAASAFCTKILLPGPDFS